MHFYLNNILYVLRDQFALVQLNNNNKKTHNEKMKKNLYIQVLENILLKVTESFYGD
jgi:hypothetical protein